jgi:hypothetical protein
LLQSVRSFGCQRLYYCVQFQNKEAGFCWERERPLRIEGEARTAAWASEWKRLSVLRTLCGRDARAPATGETKIMAENGSEVSDLFPGAMLKDLQELRRSLLHLHKTLLEMERRDFERDFGRLNSGELLQLVINHAQFAWLRLISALVVEIDEMLNADEPATVNDFQELLTQARLLFNSPADKAFKEKFQAALQREPAAVVAHSEVMNLLRRDSNG